MGLVAYMSMTAKIRLGWFNMKLSKLEKELGILKGNDRLTTSQQEALLALGWKMSSTRHKKQNKN